MSRTCAACHTLIGPNGRSGKCPRCAAADPERRARIAESQRKRWAALLANPAARAEAVANGKALRRAHPSTPEVVAKQVAARAARYAPPAGYEQLDAALRAKRVPAAERRRMIQEQVEADDRARRAAMTPFERQLARVAAGAAVVPAFKPRRADYVFTLGGIASGLL